MNATSQTAIVALLAWPVVSLVFFALFNPWRAVIASCLGAYLLLPGRASIPMSGLPDYTKYTAATLGALVGILIFDTNRLTRFQPRWFDLAILTLCLVPAASFAANGLDVWSAVSAVSDMVLNWGMPYFLGRLYVDRPGSARELALGLTVVGVATLPFIAFEVATARSISAILYNIQAPYGIKYGLYNPSLILNHALELAHWSALTAVAAYGLWCTRSVTTLAGLPFGYWAAAAAAGPILCHQTTAVALFGLGVFLISMIAGRPRLGTLPEWSAFGVVALAFPKLGIRFSLSAAMAIAGIRYLRDRHPRMLIYAIIATVPFYLTMRVSNAVSRQTLTMGAYALLGTERGWSLSYRIGVEEEMVRHTMDQPLLGWATFTDGRAMSRRHLALDSQWIIQFARYGIVGLAALYGVLCLPTLLTAMRRPVEEWSAPHNGPVVGLVFCLVIYTFDSMVNAYAMPPVPVITGLLIALPASRAGRMGTEMAVVVDRGLEQVDQLVALGRLADAEAACRQLIALRSTEPSGQSGRADAYDRLADLLEAVGRSDEAEPPRRTALELRSNLVAFAPDNPAAREALAGCCERLARNVAARGRPGEAIELRDIALEHRAAVAAAIPDDPEALSGYLNGLNDLAWLLSTADDPAVQNPRRAVAMAEQAVRICPDRKAFWNTLAAAYHRAGEPGAAVAALRNSERLGPDDLGFDDVLLALAMIDLGDPGRAAEALARLDKKLSRGVPAPASLLQLQAKAAVAVGRPPAVIANR